MSIPYISLNKPLNESALICRGCLIESGEMKNIIEWGLSEEFFKLTEIKVSCDDAKPLLICLSCELALESCRQFRQQCLLADASLKKRMQNGRPAAASAVPAAAPDPEARSAVSYELARGAGEGAEGAEGAEAGGAGLVVRITPAGTAAVALACPLASCRGRAPLGSRARLRLHLVGEHGFARDCRVAAQFFCPERGCRYHRLARPPRHFAERKRLRQHQLQVHAPRELRCRDCGAAFAQDAQLRRHARDCGGEHRCALCGRAHASDERLSVHLLRRHPAAHRKRKAERRLRRAGERAGARPQPPSPPRSPPVRNDVALVAWASRPAAAPRRALHFPPHDIHTQTPPLEFGLSAGRAAETQTAEAPVASMHTQTGEC